MKEGEKKSVRKTIKVDNNSQHNQAWIEGRQHLYEKMNMACFE